MRNQASVVRNLVVRENVTLVTTMLLYLIPIAPLGCATVLNDRTDKLRINLKIIETKAQQLPPEAMPHHDLKLRDEPIDPRKLLALKKLVTHFNSQGDPLMNEVFAPFHRDRKFSVRVLVTSGIPAPYDAWTATYGGEITIFFNLSEWTASQLERSGLGVIKHEVTHVLLEPLLKKPTTSFLDIRGPNDVLDAIIVNEGIAHYIGYPDRLSLLTEKTAKWLQAEEELAKARAQLASPQLSQQTKAALLGRADTGPFWDKYAAISGMFRAAKLYESEGARGLIEAIEASELPKK